jgi:tape measure domain-containing protein
MSTLERAFVGAARGIGQALGVFVSGEAFRRIAEVADQFERYRLTLLATGQSQSDVARAQQELTAISQRTSTGLKDTEGNYVTLTTALREFGTSQSDIGKVTETIQQGFRLSGKTAQEASGFIKELADSLKEDKVGTSLIDKLNTEAPALARVIEQQTGKTISDLRKMAEEEELTTDKFVQILANARNRIAADGSLLPPSFSEQLTQAGNAVTSFFSSIDTRSGVFAAVGAGLVAIAENLGNIGNAALVAAAGFIAFKVAAGGGFGGVLAGLQSLVAGLYQVVAAQLAALATNPWALLAALIAATVAAIYLFGDAIKVSSDGVVSLSDYFRAAFQIIGELIGPVVNFLRDGFVTAYNGITDAFSKLGSFFGVTLDDVLGFMKTAVGTYIGLWIGLYNSITAAFGNLPAALEAIFKTALNGAIALMEDGINKIIGLINQLFEKVGVSTIDAVKIGRLELSQDALDVSTKIKQGFTEGVQQGQQVLQGAIDGLRQGADALSQRARTIAEERKKLAAIEGGLSTARGKRTFSGSEDDNGGGAADGAKKLERELSNLIKTLDPLTAAQEKLRVGTETLNRAFDAGLISAERRDFLLGRLRRQLEDQLDPLGAYNRKLDEEEKLLRLSNAERDIQNRLLSAERELRQKGIDLGPQELAQLEQRIRTMQQIKEQSQFIENSLTRAFKSGEDALVQFIEKGKVDFKSLVTSLISDLARLAYQQFISKPLAGALTNVLGGIFGGGSGGSGGGGLFSGIGSFFSSLFGGAAAAEGNNWTVGGSGGIDSQLVAFRASPGETVKVSAPGRDSGSGAQQVNITVVAQDARSFLASESQVAAAAARAVNRGRRNL